jgi:hypothetical protein
VATPAKAPAPGGKERQPVAPSSKVGREVKAEKGKAQRTEQRLRVRAAKAAKEALAKIQRALARGEAVKATAARHEAEKAARAQAKVTAAMEPASAVLNTPKHPAAVSTRLPSEPQQRLTGVDTNAINTSVVDWQSALIPQAHEWLKKATDVLTGRKLYTPDKGKQPPEYIGMRPGPRNETPEQAANRFIGFAQGNIMALYKAVPDAWRDQASQWYDGANKLTNQWSKEYGYSPQQIAGAIAAMSPKKDWFQNVDIAKRLMEYRRDYGKDGKFKDATFDSSGDPKHPGAEEAMLDMMSRSGKDRRIYFQNILDRIKGKKLWELTDPLEQASWINMHDMAHGDRRYKKISPGGEFSEDWATNKDVDEDEEDDENGPPKGDPASATASTWATGDNIAKAIRILNDGKTRNISLNLGKAHKVRNFYMNIIDPGSHDGHVTIDTHAIAGAFLRPLGQHDPEVRVGLGNGSPADKTYGLGGTYPMIAEAYRRAAAEASKLAGHEILPRQMQSITWEALRGTFTPEDKRDKKLGKAIDDTWKKYMSGETTIEDARKEVMRLGSPKLGGVPRTPKWFVS